MSAVQSGYVRCERVHGPDKWWWPSDGARCTVRCAPVRSKQWHRGGLHGTVLATALHSARPRRVHAARRMWRQLAGALVNGSSAASDWPRVTVMTMTAWTAQLSLHQIAPRQNSCARNHCAKDSIECCLTDKERAVRGAEGTTHMEMPCPGASSHGLQLDMKASTFQMQHRLLHRSRTLRHLDAAHTCLAFKATQQLT